MSAPKLIIRVDKRPIKIPDFVGQRGTKAKYPYRDLTRVGMSFWVKLPKGMKPRRLQSTLYTVTSRFGSRNGLKFCTRSMDGGIRVWRVK